MGSPFLAYQLSQDVISCVYFSFCVQAVFFKRQCAIQSYAQVCWVWAVNQLIVLPSDVQFFFGYSVSEMERTNLGFAWIWS